MPVHDGWLRVTPYELAVPGRVFAEKHFAAMGEEMDTRGVDPGDPGSFVLLGATGAAIREIRGETEDPGLIHQHGVLLFHSWHLWKGGERLFLLSEAGARGLLGPLPSAPGWEPRLEIPAGYVQFPQHLVWIRQGEGERPESVDGLFWAACSGDTVGLLYISGVIRDRPGFSVIPLPPVPRSELGRWADSSVREEGKDFGTTLPGGELEELHSLESGGEALKLGARLLRRIEALEPGEPEIAAGGENPDVGEGGPEPGRGPIPSRLPWRRIP